MLGSLGTVALGLVPVYLTYRVWQHVAYTRTLEKALGNAYLAPVVGAAERAGTSNTHSIAPASDGFRISGTSDE